MTKKAFTLIELLVVISIIGILVGLSIFGLQGARTASRDARRKADLEQIRSGLEIYKADCSSYPVGSTLPSPLKGTGGLTTSCSSSNEYIGTVPGDPVSGQFYTYTSDGAKYYICAALEQTPTTLPSSDDLSKCGACGGDGCNYVVKNP